MNRERTLVGFGLVGLVGLGSLAVFSRCTSAEQRPAQTAKANEAAVSPPIEGAEEPAASAPSPAGKSVVQPDPSSPGATASGVPVNGAPSGATPAPAQPSSGAGQRITRALASSDPADLELFSRIERELGREPPPEVRALARRRAEGAGRDELLGLARALPDFQLRVLVLRWVDEVRPPAGGAARAPGVPASGSAPPLVKPITPAR